MTSREVVFIVRLPIIFVWSFMNDRVEVGCLFPGCKRVEILNDLDSVWTVTFFLGPFSRTLELQARTIELVENERISWSASHKLLGASGNVTFKKISEEETEITYRLEAHVTGFLTFLNDMVVAEKLGEVLRIFIKNVRERLEMKAGKKT